MLPRAAVYCRVSTIGQAQKGYSLSEQQKKLPRLAKERGFLVEEDDIFAEVESGSADDRPQYNRLMARVMEGHYQAVFVVERSRLSRTESRAEEERIVKSLKQFGCVVVTPESTFDPSSLEGEFVWDVSAAVDRMERKRIRLRMSNGRKAKLEQGGFYGHRAPTGYNMVRSPETGKFVFELDEEAARPVKLAYAMALSGAGLVAICKGLFKQGFMNRNGNPYEPTSVYQWLRSPTYAGYAHRGMARTAPNKANPIMVEATYIDQPLVSPESWERVQALLDSRSHVKSGRFPLSGILVCPGCGHKLMASYRGTAKVRKYVCMPKAGRPDCPSPIKAIPMATAHQLFIESLPTLIENVDRNSKKIHAHYANQNSSADTDSEEAVLLSRKTDIERRIRIQLVDQEASPSDYRQERIAQLEKEAKAITAQLSKIRRPLRVVPDFPCEEGWFAILNTIKADDHETLDSLARLLVSRIHWTRFGPTHRKLTYCFVEIETPWGEQLKV
jgi:site-specific DNA recombinase